LKSKNPDREIIYNHELYQQKHKATYGELSNLITDDLIDLCKKSKHILIYGHTKSGKVLLGKLLAGKLGCDLIISDDYKYLGWSNNMYYVKEHLLQKKYKDKQVIYEGIQTCRALRKGVQLDDYYPDMVIHVTCDYNCIEKCYYRDMEGHKLKGGKVKIFNEKVLDKIFFDWWEILPKNKRPILVNIDTSF